MNIFSKSKSIPLWALIPIAIGIHGLILAIPIALDNPVEEKAKSDPVKLQKLPSSKVSAMPKPKISSSPSPSSAIVPPVPIQNNSSVPTTVPQPIASTAAPSQPSSQAPATPTQPATPPQPATPAQPATPPKKPENASDFFQIAGSVACDTVKDCYSTDSTTGVSVADQTIANLNQKGYNTKERADLRYDDQPMKIYEIKKDPKTPPEYLHVIWGRGTGTRILTLPRIVTNWEDLATIAKL